MLTSYLIVPAWSDQAGQLRIVAREHDTKFRMTLADYRNHPDLWKEVGLVNSDGRLKCIEAPVSVGLDLQAQQPLLPPTVYTYNAKGEPA